MEVGSSSAAVSQAVVQQQSRPSETQPRQAELETSSSQPTPQNSPTPDSRVGSVINTQA